MKPNNMVAISNDPNSKRYVLGTMTYLNLIYGQLKNYTSILNNFGTIFVI